jgi:hypothetical protein
LINNIIFESGDSLRTSGAIAQRPIAGDDTAVVLVIQRRSSGSPTRAARDLHRLFVERAAATRPGSVRASAAG